MTPRSVEHPQPNAPAAENSLVEFRRLQERLKELTGQLAPYRNERGDLYQECVGASLEQPPFDATMTEHENQDLARLVDRIEQFFAERERPKTVH